MIARFKPYLSYFLIALILLNTIGFAYLHHQKKTTKNTIDDILRSNCAHLKSVTSSTEMSPAFIQEVASVTAWIVDAKGRVMDTNLDTSLKAKIYLLLDYSQRVLGDYYDVIRLWDEINASLQIYAHQEVKLAYEKVLRAKENIREAATYEKSLLFGYLGYDKWDVDIAIFAYFRPFAISDPYWSYSSSLSLEESIKLLHEVLTEKF